MGGPSLSSQVANTASIAKDCKPTSHDVGGPYYLPGAPKRNNFICKTTPADTRLILSGRVFGEDCQNPMKATIDGWQADTTGNYSNFRRTGAPPPPTFDLSKADWTCRGVVGTDVNGYFKFETLMPGHYDDFAGFRPAHLHLMINANDTSYPPLITQLYFRNDKFLGEKDSCKICASNDTSLIVDLQQESGNKSFAGSWKVVLSKQPPKAPGMRP